MNARIIFHAAALAVLAATTRGGLGARGRPKGANYALLVGCSKYNPDQLPPLKYTGNDMTDFADALRDAGWRRRGPAVPPTFARHARHGG